MPIRELVRFSVPYLQVLDEHGVLDRDLEPDLQESELLTLYQGMVRAREADQRMLKLQRQGRLGTFPPCTGQEAVACAATLAMRDTDWFVGSYREFGGRLMRGEPFERYLEYHAGYEEGSSSAASGRMLPNQVILGSQVLHAVGIAYAMRMLGEKDTAVVTFFGDGASSQGDVHEAFTFAGVWNVPVVFICQNNGWAISIPRARQTRAETLAQKAIAYGFSGIQVDGNDALAVYRATKEALDRARAGGGPTLIEAVTYRLMMHTTADDPGKYRDPAEEKAWWDRDPLPRFRRYLESRGLWDDVRQARLEAEVKEQVEASVKTYESKSGYKPDAPFDHVFGTRHASIEEQRAAFLENLEQEANRG